MDSEEAI